MLVNRTFSIDYNHHQSKKGKTINVQSKVYKQSVQTSSKWSFIFVKSKISAKIVLISFSVVMSWSCVQGINARHIFALLWFHLINQSRRIFATYIFPGLIAGIGFLILIPYFKGSDVLLFSLDNG